MRAAAHLKIPFIEVDLSKEYEQEVFLPSIEEFKKGKTPNPDTLCNEKIKFGIFLDFCKSHGADFVATGHYARILEGSTLKSPELRSNLGISADENKDQSYFLWAVPETVLRHTMFPVGGLHKPQVRALAEKFGLPNASRPDSQGLCFLGDISLQDMLARELEPQQGSVLSEDGMAVGVHGGAQLYTLGQRHGFSLLHDTPHASAHYIIAKDIKKNTITVSDTKFPRNAKKTEVILINTNWIGEVAVGVCEARFRYRQPLMQAELFIEGDAVRVVLGEPQYVPLGQSLVLYRGERCLGGGVIKDATLIQ